MSISNHKPLHKPALSRFAQLALLLVLTFELPLTLPLPTKAAPAIEFTCTTVTEILQTECEALVALYNSTNGTQWHIETDWLKTSTPCSWLGIICFRDSVIFLRLRAFGLSGSIPPELGNLSNLAKLELANNQLSGTLPATLCTLPLVLGANFDYNLLAASDPCIDRKFPNWAQTQTVPPTNLQALALANQQVQVTWTPITYTANGGYYTVLHAPTVGGPYTAIGQTADKMVNTITLPPLGAGTHYLVVQTFTPQHDAQQNDLISDNSSEVMIVFNTPPLAISSTTTTTQGSALTIYLKITDVDNDTFSYALLSLPTYGALHGSSPSLTYTPAPGFTGLDSFTFKGNDGQADSNLATITIQVVAAPLVNTPPVAHHHTLTMTQDMATAITLTATDGEHDALTYQVISQPGHGLLSGVAPALVYTPITGYSGADSFTFQVSDGQLTSAAVNVQLNVTAQLNRPPTLQDDAFTVTRNSQANVLAVLTNDSDADGDELTLVTVASPLNGTAQIVNGQLLYTPAAAFVGMERFTYTVSDGKTSVVTTVTVTVMAPVDGVTVTALYLPLVRR